MIDGGGLRGLVPKQHLPNYKEFYERRWFRPARGEAPLLFGDLAEGERR